MSHTDTYRKSITGQEMANAKAPREEHVRQGQGAQGDQGGSCKVSERKRSRKAMEKRLWCVLCYVISDSIFKRITLAAVRKMSHKRTKEEGPVRITTKFRV